MFSQRVPVPREAWLASVPRWTLGANADNGGEDCSPHPPRKFILSCKGDVSWPGFSVWTSDPAPLLEDKPGTLLLSVARCASPHPDFLAALWEHRYCALNYDLAVIIHCIDSTGHLSILSSLPISVKGGWQSRTEIFWTFHLVAWRCFFLKKKNSIIAKYFLF